MLKAWIESEEYQDMIMIYFTMLVLAQSIKEVIYRSAPRGSVKCPSVGMFLTGTQVVHCKTLLQLKMSTQQMKKSIEIDSLISEHFGCILDAFYMLLRVRCHEDIMIHCD